MRKKIFATLMSVAMVASFMPSMAFAAATSHAHDYGAVSNVGSDNTVAYKDVKDAMNNAATNPYVELVKAPTCEETGVALITCKAKGCKEDYIGHTKKVTVKKLNHANTYLKEVTVDEAKAFLAKQSGETTKSVAAWAKSKDVVNACKIKATYCIDCNKIVEFDKTNGVVAHQPLKDKTCNGKTICKVCGKEVACREEGSHTFTSGKTIEVPATCTAPAKIMKVCDVCGEAVSTVDDKNVPGTKAKGHNFGTPVTAKEALTADGKTLNKGYFAITDVAGTENGFAVTKTEYYKSNVVVNGTDCENFAALQCQDCKKYVNFTTGHSMASGSLAMVEKKDFTPADASNAWQKAAAHDYVATEVPATCTENAKTVKVCKNCGDKVEVEKLNTKLGHDYKVKETAVDGNCVNGVAYTVVCTRCKTDKTPQFTATSDKDGTRYFTGFQGEPALTPGNYIKVPADKASADHKLGKQEKIADATCEHGELLAQKCTVCHKVDPKTIVEVSKAKDHTLEEVVTPETCQNTKKVETKCKVCGTVVKTVGGLEKADKKACVYDAWKVVKNPTLFEEGMKKTACSVCGQLEKDGSSIAIPKLTLGKPVVKLTSTKGRMTVKASAKYATGYKVTYKRYGKAATTKTYTAESISKTYRLLKGKKYTVTVTPFATNGTDTVEGATVTKTITIKK